MIDEKRYASQDGRKFRIEICDETTKIFLWENPASDEHILIRVNPYIGWIAEPFKSDVFDKPSVKHLTHSDIERVVAALQLASLELDFRYGFSKSRNFILTLD